jgi:hypothetical protein
MMTIVDPREISAAIEGRLALLGEMQNDWDAVEEVVATHVAPLVERHGSPAVLKALEQAKHDPLIAAVLVDGAGIGDFRLPRSGREFLRISEIYGDDEILEAALAYLQKFPDGTLLDGHWGWTVLWNGWEQLETDDHLRLVTTLIRRAPDDDETLAAIADGPVRELFDEGREGDRLLDLARKDAKIARVFSLM